jgi:hypothetical protein
MANNPLNNKFCARATFTMAAGNNNTSVSADGGKVIIPEGALIMNAYYFVSTTFVDADAGDSSTIALGYTGATGAFVAAVAITGTNNPYDAGVHGTLTGFAGGLDEGDDAGTALENIQSKAVTLVQTTADVELLLTIGNERDVATGKLDLYVEYVMTGKIA